MKKPKDYISKTLNNMAEKEEEIKLTIPIQLECGLFKQDGVWLIHCDKLDITATGDTEQKALDNITEAIHSWITRP